MLKRLIIAVPFLFSACVVSGCVDSTAPTGGATSNVNAKRIEISTPALVPVFAGTETNSGLWLHNETADRKINRIYVTSSASSSSVDSVGKSVVRTLIKTLPAAMLSRLGIDNPDLTTIDGFTVDQATASNCISEISKGLGSQCYLGFKTPLVKDPSGNDYVVLHVVDNHNVDNQQIISWTSIAAANMTDSKAFMTSMPSNISAGGYATAYVYTGASSNFGVAKLNMDINPEGSAYIVNGYTSVTEVIPGQIIPVEVQMRRTNQSNAASNKVLGVKTQSLDSIGLYSSLTLSTGETTTSGVLTLSLTSADTANLVSSNIPTLFTVESGNLHNSYTVMLYNNGTESATGVSITSANPSFATVSGTAGCATIAPNGTCSYTVTAVSAGSVTINYSYTSSNSVQVSAIPSTTFTVINNAVKGAYLTVTAPGVQSLGLKKGTANESVVVTFSVSNSSLSPESATSLSFSGLATGTAAEVVSGSNSNTCSGGLLPGATCTATFVLASLSATESGTGYVGESYSYTPGSIGVRVNSIATTTYRVYGDPVLTPDISPITMVVVGSMGLESHAVVVITNTGNESAILGSYTLLESVTGLAVPTSTVSIESTGTCNSGTTLGLNESCLLKIQLGPKYESVQESGIASYVLNYSNGRFPGRNIFSTQVIINWTIKTQDTDMQLINIESVSVSNVNAVALSGVGTSGSPMVFGGGATAQGIRLTYQNTSSIFQINKQMFQLSNLPQAWYVESNSSTCGFAQGGTAKLGTIESGGTCILVLLVNKDIIASLATTSGVASVDIPSWPTATWQATPSINGVGGESVFSYNGNSSFVGNYQTAVLNTTFTPSTGWSSLTVTQALSNATGYGSVVNTAKFIDGSTSFTESGLTNCTVSTGAESTSVITCNLNGTTATTGTWSISIESAALQSGQVLPVTNTLVSANPIVANPSVATITR